MTIASETRRAGPYSGNGSTQVFNFSFKTYSSADIVVVTTTSGVDTVKTITTHYTVSLNADQNASPGGSITMLTAPASGTTVTIVSDRAALQSLNAQNAGAFLPTVLNDAMDNLAIGIGQLQDQQERSLRGALSDSAWDRLPPASERAGGLLGFDDSTGQPMIADFGTVEALATDINTVAAMAADIAIVADADVDIGTVADNIAAVTEVSEWIGGGGDAGDIEVISTGGITPRSLSDRFEKTVLDFGAVGDCTAAETGTDDAAAIQLAFNWWIAADNRKLIFPSGYRFRVGSTCTADFGGDGARGAQIVMDSPITPDTGVGNAFEFIDIRYLHAKLWVDGGGDSIVDYHTADPVGAQQAFLIRGVRNADLWVTGNDYDGRVVRVTAQGVGEEKTSRLVFHSFITGESGAPCGQSIYVDATSACAIFDVASWFFDAYGPFFYETDDLFFGQIEGGLWSTAGMVIEGCRSVWASAVALGDESFALNLLTIRGSSTPTYSGNIYFGSLFLQLAAKGLVLEDVGVATNTPSIHIDALYTINNAQHGLYIDASQRFNINHYSVGDNVSVETTGACNGRLHMDVLGSDVGTLIIGSTAANLIVSGRIKTPNSTSAATTDAVTVNSTGAGIVFDNLSIESTTARYAYNLAAGNKVSIRGGNLNLSGATTAMGPNAPFEIVGRVQGFKGGGWQVVGQGAVQVSHTGNTSETTLATVTIPAGAMGANGRVRITATWGYTNNANNKTVRIRFGGSQVFASANTTTVQQRAQVEVANRNSESSQVGGVGGGSTGFGSSTTALGATTINTAAAVNVTFTGTLADGADSVSIESYLVEVFYEA